MQSMENRMTTSPADLAVDTAPKSSRTAILAGVIGNVLEWYDFAVYGFFVPVISHLFFPTQTPLMSLLLTFSVFGVGFAMRPLGSILFGIYGDRHGRRAALSTVVTLMAIATLAVGLLPTYGQVGVLAPLLLVLARLLQGLSSGGEWGGAAAYLVEFAPAGRRGFIGSWQQASVGCGFLLGALSAALLTSALPQGALMSWGWRLPFLAGVLLGAVGLYMRLRLDDTPQYVELEHRHKVAANPLREAFTTYRKQTLLTFGITLHNAVAYYVVLVYMTTYLTSIVKMPRSTALWIGTVCLAVFVILTPLMGRLSDRIGRRPLFIISSGGYCILAYPLFVMASSGSVALAFLTQLILVVLLAVYAGPGPALYAELFPTRVRYTALSVGYNIPVAIFGGFAPFIATGLIHLTGSILSPAIYVMIASGITLSTRRWVRETAFEKLG
jgi:MFS transporter, MHS family, proline/betaine transporter